MACPGIAFATQNGTEERNDINTEIGLASMLWLLQGLFDSVFSLNSTWILQHAYISSPLGNISTAAMKLFI